MTPSPPSDSPEAALARYLATVNARLAQKRELRRRLEDAKIQKQRQPFWWLKDGFCNPNPALDQHSTKTRRRHEAVNNSETK